MVTADPGRRCRLPVHGLPARRVVSLALGGAIALIPSAFPWAAGPLLRADGPSPRAAGSSRASVQAARSGTRTAQSEPVPVEQEPAHRPVFRNASVAVLDVRFPPGYTSLFHTHASDNVSVRIETSLTRVDQVDTPGVPNTPPVGRVAFNSATPPYTHRVVNLGTTPIFTFDVELLAPSPVALRPATSDDMAGHEVVIDNARVRASRIRLGSGAAPVGPHTHRRGWLEVRVTGARAGTYVWHDAGDQVTLDPRTATEFVEVEVQ
jgi:hypothetical protein